MKKVRKLFGIITFILASINLYIIFFQAPIETTQGEVQKIMYIHVPSIILAYLAFFIVFIASIGYLWKRKEHYDLIALAAAEIGTLLTGICLITGSIWGKPTWNTYWTWDARLTITLIIFLLFSGYILVRKFSEFGEKQAVFCAVIGILGFFTIPLNHMVVKWWRALHQPSSLFSGNSVLPDDIKQILYLSMVSFLVLFIYLILSRIELELKQRNYNKQLQLLMN